MEQELAIPRAQLVAFVRDSEELAAESAAVTSEMSARVRSLESSMAKLVEQGRFANLRYFVPRSERVPEDQICFSLFNDAQAWMGLSEPEPDPGEREPAEKRSRRRIGRHRINTSRLERVVVEHDPKDRRCLRCGSEMAEMKVEVTEVIRLVTAHLVIEEQRCHVCRCKPATMSKGVARTCRRRLCVR